MYKNQRRTIEDGLMSGMYLETIQRYEAHSYKDNFDFKAVKKLIQNDLEFLCGTSHELKKKVLREAKNQFRYFERNNFNTRKCFLTIALVASTLHDNEMAELPDGMVRLVEDSNKELVKAMNSKKSGFKADEIVKIYRSCEKHATKLIGVLQKNGYY